MDPNLLLFLLASLPIITLVVLLVWMHWTAQQAGTASIFVAAAVSLFAFEVALPDLGVSAAKGVWDALPILCVIWPALLLYKIMHHSGGYDALRQGIAHMSRNELFVVVALGWVFVSFLQGIDGFGTPIAVVAPLLVALGMRATYAVAIPIIAHIWAKFYGTLGVGWLATLRVVYLSEADIAATALLSSSLMVIQVVLGGFTVVWLYGRWAAVRAGWPLVLIISVIHGLGQVVSVYIDPVLAAFLPATAAVVVLYPLSRWKRYREPDPSIIDRPAMKGHAELDDHGKVPPMSTVAALAPYGLLTVLAAGSSLIEPLHQWLAGPKIGLDFPAVNTGLGVLTSAGTQIFRPFNNPGFTVLLTALTTWIIYAQKGYFTQWAGGSDKAKPNMMRELCDTAVPASVPIVAFLVMASIMKHTGQNTMLAVSIAAIAPTYVFAFMSNGIGVLGAFMTSSSTSSQVLFSNLQVSLAEAKGLPTATILAAQCAGGAIGNAIAPANLVMGASTAGISGQEGRILRLTIPWTAAAFVLTGVGTVLLVLFA